MGTEVDSKCDASSALGGALLEPFALKSPVKGSGGSLDLSAEHLSGAAVDEEAAGCTSHAGAVERAFVTSHGPTLSESEIAALKAGVPGAIREDLLDAHVARVFNSQLAHYPIESIRSALWSHPGAPWLAQQAYEMVTQYGSIEQLAQLGERISTLCSEPGRSFYCPPDTSLGAAVRYLGVNKGILPVDWKLRTKREIEPRSVVVLDEVVMARLVDDAVFRREVVNAKAALLCPLGWIHGVTPFRTPSLGEIDDRVTQVILRAEIEPHDSPGRSAGKIRSVLESDVVLPLRRLDPRLVTQLEFVSPPPAGGEPVERIARQLNGRAGIAPDALSTELARFGPEYRSVIKELVVQHARVHSHISLARAAREHGRLIGEFAAERGAAIDDVCFLCPEPNKSFGMYGLIFRQANSEIPSSAFVTCARLGPWVEARSDKPKLVVILDDIAGSGESLKKVLMPTFGWSSKLQRSEIVLSPLIASERALEALYGAPVSRECAVVPASIEPRVVGGAFISTVSPAERLTIRAALGGLGFNESGIMVALPYMSPDNNVELFARCFAPYVTLKESAVRGWMGGSIDFAMSRRGAPFDLIRAEAEAKLKEAALIAGQVPTLHDLVEHEGCTRSYWEALPEELQAELVQEWCRAYDTFERERDSVVGAQLRSFGERLADPKATGKDALRVSIEFGVLLAAAGRVELSPHSQAAIEEFRKLVPPPAFGLR